ncbi:MAG: hypothetical protein ABIH92_02855 [Nanoarchaeota archaeon]
MCENLSLLKHCIPCKAKCCKTGKLIGTPILSEDEASKVKKMADEHIKEVTSPTGEKYYTILEQKGTQRCVFLTDKNKCRIQDIKPLDCLCYPIKAVHAGDAIKFIIDKDCPASKHLSKEFIEDAKKTALKSIKRFDKQTYQHWLDDYIGWVKNSGVELEQFLASS